MLFQSQMILSVFLKITLPNNITRSFIRYWTPMSFYHMFPNVEILYLISITEKKTYGSIECRIYELWNLSYIKLKVIIVWMNWLWKQENNRISVHTRNSSTNDALERFLFYYENWREHVWPTHGALVKRNSSTDADFISKTYLQKTVELTVLLIH